MSKMSRQFLEQGTLELLTHVKAPEKFASLNELVKLSGSYSKHAPSTTSWLQNIVSKDASEKELVDYANTSYPILHERVLPLVHDFLQFKKANGTPIERHVYTDLNLLGLVERMISKRPRSFYGAHDKYLLRDGRKGSGKWELIGNQSVEEDWLPEYMSYDEIKLAALLQVSSPVCPINRGSRDNKGKRDSDHVKDAVYVAAVGARFTKKGKMEFQEIAITSTQNTPQNGYGKNRVKPNLNDVFAKFYSLEYFPSFDESGGKDFNGPVYSKRIKTSIETFLIEANSRGSSQGRKVYVHVVGLGLGVWMYKPDVQNELYLTAFENVLNEVRLPNISDIDFSWIDTPKGASSKLKNGSKFAGKNDIKISFSKHDPFAASGEKSGKLVVALYAWDGNSFPGNEFWSGQMGSTGDSAAACCSQIPELQNAYINRHNICAENLHIASRKYGLLHVAEYAQKVLAEQTTKS